MDGTKIYHPEWDNPVTKEDTWYVLTDKCILAKKLGIPKTQFTDYMKFKWRNTKMWMIWSYLEGGNKILARENIDKVWSRHWRKGHPEIVSPGIHAIYRHQNETLSEAKKCLLTWAWYSCLLRVSAKAWQTHRHMLSANHYTEHMIPNGGVRERTEGAEGVFNFTGRTISTNQTPPTPAQSSQELNHQRVHMDWPMPPPTYVAEVGLAGPYWEEKPLVLWRLDAPV